MNLIVDERKLDRHQERAIYELTLKKQRSKKSTVSHKQVVAMQQLANELVAQRKSALEMLDLNHNLSGGGGGGGGNQITELGPRHKQLNFSGSQRYPPFKTTICRCHSASALAGDDAPAKRESNSASIGETSKLLRASHHSSNEQITPEKQQQQQDQTLTESCDSTNPSDRTASTLTASSSLNKKLDERIGHKHEVAKELQRQSSTSTIATNSTSSSVSSSSSSASATSSSRHHNQTNQACQIVSSSSFISSASSSSISDETSKKLNQLRLEQLNNELERRLHQYEYLVAQERAILGTRSLNLVSSGSVNNFHLFTRLDQKNLF